MGINNIRMSRRMTLRDGKEIEESSSEKETVENVTET